MRLAEQGPQPADAVGDELVEGDSLAVGGQGPGLDAAEAEQVGDNAVQALGLVADGLEQLGPRLVVVGGAVTQVAGDRPDAGQRCPQVVGDRAEEGGTLLVHSLEHLRPRGFFGQLLALFGHGP